MNVERFAMLREKKSVKDNGYWVYCNVKREKSIKDNER